MKLSWKFLPLLLIGFSCKSTDEPEPAKLTGTQLDYTGSTYRIYKSANQWDGYKESDTLYTDQVTVKTTADSIAFIWGTQTYAFKKSASNHYEVWTGTKSNYKFDMLPNDSLKCSYWSYGGNSSSFNSVNIDFKGRKR